MIEISYDRNDKEEQKLIEDYYFYKNFVEVLRNDWKDFYLDRYDKEKYKIIILKINLMRYLKEH